MIFFNMHTGSDELLSSFPFQLYELDNDPKRKDFLDDLFTFMQKRGETFPPGFMLLQLTFEAMA